MQISLIYVRKHSIIQIVAFTHAIQEHRIKMDQVLHNHGLTKLEALLGLFMKKVIMEI